MREVRFVGFLALLLVASVAVAGMADRQLQLQLQPGQELSQAVQAAAPVQALDSARDTRGADQLPLVRASGEEAQPLSAHGRVVGNSPAAVRGPVVESRLAGRPAAVDFASGETSRTYDNGDGTYTTYLKALNDTDGGRPTATLTMAWGFAYPENCPASGYGWIPSQGYVYDYDFGTGYGVELCGDNRFLERYDISSIPDDATVSQVDAVKYYTSYSMGGTQACVFDYHLVTTTQASGCSAIVADILAGTTVGSVNVPYLAYPTTGNVTTTLAAAARTNLMAALAGAQANWHLGSDWTGLTTGDVLHLFGASFTGQNPQLVVTYTSATLPPVIGTIAVNDTVVYTVGNDTLDVVVGFTDADGGSFTATLYGRAETGATEDYYPSILTFGTGVVTGSMPNYTATFSLNLKGSVEPGLYDLKVTVSDGTATATSPFDDNLDAFRADYPSNVLYHDDWNQSWSDPPAGWTVTGTTTGAWSSAWHWTAYPDDYFCLAGNATAAVSTVMTRTFDFTDWTGPHFNFWSDWQGTGSATGLVEWSTDGGSTWAPLLSLSAGSGAVKNDYDYLLSGGGGQDDIVLRFSFNAAANEGLWIINTMNVWGNPSDPSPVITSVGVVGSPVENIGPDVFDFVVDFTDAGTHVAGDFLLEGYVRSDVGDAYTLGIPDTVVSTGANAWRATWTGIDLRDTIEIGLYDLAAYVDDGLTADFAWWEENANELSVVSPANVFYYNDWNEVTTLPPTGWTMTTTTGNDWISVYYTDVPDNLLIGADSGAIQTAQNTTTQLVSDPFNCAGYGAVYLSFFSDFTLANSATATVSFSTNGGSIWTPVVAYTATESGDYSYELVGAAGQSDVRIRLHFDALSGANLWVLNTFQIYEISNAPAVLPAGGVMVAPGTVETLNDDTATFSGTFTDSDSTLAQMRLTLNIRSAEAMEYALITFAANGVDGLVITEPSAGTFNWTLAGVDFTPMPAPGAYDLELTVYDGWTDATDAYANNNNELTLTATGELVQYFNNGGVIPAGWTVTNGPAHTAVDSWVFDVAWSGTTDYTASAWYETDAQSDTYLTSPVFNCSAATMVDMYYFTQWATGYDANSLGEIQYSIDGGANWDWLIRYEGEATGGVVYSGVGWWDVSSVFAGQANCRVRLWYYGYDDWYWLVDPFLVYSITPPPIPAMGPFGILAVVLGLSALIVRRRRK